MSFYYQNLGLFSGFKLEINNKRISGKTPVISLNDTLINNSCVKEEIKVEIIKHFRCNQSENTTYQNWWPATKVVSRGEVIAPNIKNEKVLTSLKFLQMLKG